MKASVYLLLGWAVLSTTLLGCSSASESGTSADSSETGDAVLVADSAESGALNAADNAIKIEQRFQQGALVLDIKAVHLTPEQVTVEVEITNQADRIIRFYPNQGRLSTGVDELKANIFLTDDSLSGVLQPQERKAGVLVFSSRFEEELDFSTVRSLQLSLGQVIDMASIEPETVDIVFSLESSS